MYYNVDITMYRKHLIKIGEVDILILMVQRPKAMNLPLALRPIYEPQTFRNAVYKPTYGPDLL